MSSNKFYTNSVHAEFTHFKSGWTISNYGVQNCVKSKKVIKN